MPISSGAVSGISPSQGRGYGDKRAATISPTNEQIKKIVSEMRTQLADTNVSVNFSTYGNHGEKIAVVVTDKASGKVIREIPSKELQKLYQNIDELVGKVINDAV